jgi:hypothetical protein
MALVQVRDPPRETIYRLSGIKQKTKEEKSSPEEVE